MKDNHLTIESECESFINQLKTLNSTRKNPSVIKRRAAGPTRSERKEIFLKTGGLCHVCGEKLEENKFQADHVKPFKGGGECRADNYLPACTTCNNYRWHYQPEEHRIILKLGVFVRTLIEKDTKLGKEIALAFLKKEEAKKKRLKKG